MCQDLHDSDNRERFVLPISEPVNLKLAFLDQSLLKFADSEFWTYHTLSCQLKKNGRMYGTIEELTTQYVKQYTIMFYRLKIFASDTMIAKKMIIFALRLRLLVLALFHLAPHFNLSLRCRSCKRLLVNRYL